jgi:glycosyltransferase involved in cell wall biosynthesis
VSEPLSASVVICAYAQERWEDLARAVASALEQTHPPREVVVAVDHNEGLLARAGRELTGARVVANVQTPGLSGARNSGAAATSAPVVAFLDDDARADPGWLEQLLIPYERPELLGAGGSIRPDWQAPRPPWFPEEFLWTVGCSYRGLPLEPAPVRNMIGANMSVRRSVLEALGGFREELGRVEETDFCIRGLERFPDGVWLYWPAAGISHSVSATRTTWSYFRARCFNEGVAKASMVVGTGAASGLESERRYATHVLPAGVARGLAGALRGDRRAAAQAAAISAGFLYTAAGYARGRLTLARRGGHGAIPRRGATP